MSIQREGRRIRLPETRKSWEDKGTSEVAAGKLEVMEKFFTPLPHSSSQRPSKSSPKEKSNWEGARNHYYKESMSSSSPSSSSSPWSSESNFRVRSQFHGYNSHAPHSRSCNDLSLAKGRANEDKRNFFLNQDPLQTKKAAREGTDTFSPVRSRAGSAKKSHPGNAKEAGPSNKSGKEGKRVLNSGSRRAKSMEALVVKESRKNEGKDKRRVTEEKQKFSRFLDEITIQVLSPSNLNSLGVKERQNLGNRDQWKNSSTDSLGSRSKRSQHNSVAEHQEVRKKGKGKMGCATKVKAKADTPEAWRRRDKSTSPDSVTSAQHRGEREDANLSASNMGHQPRRISRRLSQEKAGNPLEQTERDKKDGVVSGMPKSKTQYAEKAQNSSPMLEPTTKVPIIPPPAWWGDSGSPAATQNTDKDMDNPTDQSRRIKDKCPGTQLSNPNQETNVNTSTTSENLEQDKDSLNQKITELLDHLVRAQSTICALEKLNGCDSKPEQKHTGTSKSSLPVPSLLPAHRNPQRNHPSRASSSESSGDDALMSWTDAPTYEPPLDYTSAQKILDTLLGLKNSAQNIAKSETAGGFSSVDASKIDGHLIRSENRYSDNSKSVAPRNDAKHMSFPGVKDTLHTSGQRSQHDSMLCSPHSPLPSPAGDSAHRLFSTDIKLPPLPAKRTLVPESYINTCPALSPVGEVGFRPVGKSEGLIHHKSDCLIPTCYLSSPMQPTDPLNQHTDSYVLKSPSGNELSMGNWEGQSHHQDGHRDGHKERKSRKDRTVTFSTMNNEGQSKQSLVTARSKFTSSKIADQEDSTSMDSTLL